jgi:hypothetical protein
MKRADSTTRNEQKHIYKVRRQKNQKGFRQSQRCRLIILLCQRRKGGEFSAGVSVFFLAVSGFQSPLYHDVPLTVGSAGDTSPAGEVVAFFVLSVKGNG